MSVLVIRHALSEANNRNNIGTLAFASMEAALMELGVRQAEALGAKLTAEYSVDPATTTIAVSNLRRTQETAQKAGFKIVNRYAVLNEVSHGITLPHLRGLLDQNFLPVEALTAAEDILAAPPTEPIWITHGLVIAGLCNVLNIHQEKKLIPKFCEIRELDLP
ncbi:MAG: histidine phosphatase family protein [Patescibacteria group bacterium]|nr:histidine phosphatase family protein [Patescibacteria group bacterium]